MPSVLLIPAFRPGPQLPALLAALDRNVFTGAVIVDDGSGGEFKHVFSQCREIAGATVLHHSSNLGKGAALKTGIAHILGAWPERGIITADADGQHAPEDIVRVAGRLEREPEKLVLGARGFDGDVPRRSRTGNIVARWMVHAFMGQKLTDTQTGLRGIPPRLAEHLGSISANGYEFELDMLTAAKHYSVPVVEETIRTVYEEGNPTSHFRPLVDSMRIGFVLVRFSGLSLATAGVDNLVFLMVLHFGYSRAVAQIAARCAAVLFNYPLARRAVFFSRTPQTITLWRYLALVVVSGLASYYLIGLLSSHFGLSVPVAKVTAESGLFFVNFLLQRDFVFVRRLASRGRERA